MKKSKVLYVITWLLAGFCLYLVMTMFTGCNRAIYTLTYDFDTAQVQLQDGTVVTGKLESWCDASSLDAVQVKIDGVIYFAHMSDVTLIKGGK